MKKFFTLTLMALMTVTTALAQGKHTVCIGRFSGAGSISSGNVVALRNSVMTGLSNTGRLELTDVTATDAGEGLEAEIRAAAGAGCAYLLKGNINTLTVTKKDKYYVCEVNYTLKVTDVKEEKVFSTETLTASWHIGDTRDEAVAKALDKAADSMKKYVNDTFKTKAVVKSLDEVDKKKGAKTAYVSIGSAAGISAGQMFDIYKEIEVAGTKATKLIGAAKAKEVVADELTLVTITKGGKEVQEAFEAGETLTVETRARRPPLGGFSGILE